MYCIIMSMNEMTNNKDEEADEELLSQLKLFNEINKERSSFRHRFCRVWKSLKLRSALGHFGLMISLSIYCVVGGVVSTISNWQHGVPFSWLWLLLFYLLCIFDAIHFPCTDVYIFVVMFFFLLLFQFLYLILISFFFRLVCNCQSNMPKCQY